MDPWQIARVHAGMRAALGGALVGAPRLLGAAWVGADGRRPSIGVYSVALGARDAALGLGLLDAVRGGHGTRPWLAACVAADTADAIVTLRSRDALPAFGVVSVALMASGSAVLGAWLRTKLD